MVISDGGPTLLGNGRTGRVVFVERRSGSVRAEPTRLIIDTEALREGRPISEFVVSPSGDPGDSRRQQVTQLLTGVPVPVFFFPGRKSYKRKKSVRNDYFEAIEGVVVITPRLPDREPVSYRSDLTVSKEVPFGVLKTEVRVFDKLGTERSHVRWEISSAGKFLPRDGSTPAEDQQSTPSDDRATNSSVK